MFIRWDRLDEIYIVSVPELPGCQTHGATYEEAAKRGEEAIESWIEAAITDGTDVPAPQTVTA
ncbi:MAG: type II toxin-antitoxin system HicB family antitoxin [Chloroflexota bacterium]|nr:MAG: type II toxin-antitoxin system HicB family antitoxin [Chloroflexota bacterium]